MDTEMLSIVLDDNRTYQEASKDAYLEKLNEVFEKFKAKGDTMLIPSSGFCGSDECTNQGCKGYSFFGNKSNNYTSLVIEEENGVVTDIYQCFFMISENPLWETSHQISYSISTNDKADFVPDFNYLVLVQKCEAALNELKEQYDNKLAKDDGFNWLLKNKSLYNDIQSMILYGGVIGKLRCTYRNLERLLSFVEKEATALEATLEYQNVYDKIGSKNLEWLAKYEDFGLELECFLYDTTFDSASDINGILITLRDNNEVSLQRMDFSEICDFLMIFSPQYWDIMNQISSKLEQEKSDSLSNSNEYYQPGISLKEYLIKYRSV